MLKPLYLRDVLPSYKFNLKKTNLKKKKIKGSRRLSKMPPYQDEAMGFVQTSKDSRSGEHQ